jgi:ATP-binding cassette, subfamily B, bacterial MsbA
MRLLEKLPGTKAPMPSDTLALLRRVVADQGTRHWKAYAGAYALMAVAAGSTAASAYVLGHAVNVIYTSGDLWATIGVCFVVIAISIVRGFASYGQAVMLADINLTIASEYKILLFGRMLRESLGFFSDRHSSQINGTINFAGNAVGTTLSTLIVATGRDLVTLIALLVVMIVQAPLPSLICCLVMPMGAITVRRIRDRVRRLTEELLAQSNVIYEISQETLQGLRVVKAFGLEGSVQRRFGRGVEAIQSIAIRAVRASNGSTPLTEALGGIAVALLFMYGAYRVMVMGALPGEIFSFITAFLLAYEPLKRLARVHIDLASSLVGVRTLYMVMDAPETEPDDGHLPPLQVGHGNIEFSDVVFSYRPGEAVLRSLSFAAKGQAVTALVGTSGGGKSTIFNLLLRLYEPEAGAVTIDGQDLSKVSRASVRRQIAYVGQDTFLFHGTIRENILVGKPEATEDEIRVAASGAHAHDFICKFPQGYDTPVGEHGVQLSTGQRQRIAIARALIKDAPIVLLDESTASLDSESEREVRDAIARVCRDRTTLVIAHRLHTVLDADRIFVVENGNIAESGCYDELLRQQGRFATLSKLQFNEQAA